MKITDALTDKAVLGEVGKRVAQARLGQNVSQANLAAKAGVSKTTLERLERGGGVQLESFIRILRALGQIDRLDLVVSEPLPSPIERLESHGRKRRRAREGKSTERRAAPWTWGEDAGSDEPGP